MAQPAQRDVVGIVGLFSIAATTLGLPLAVDVTSASVFATPKSATLALCAAAAVALSLMEIVRHGTGVVPRTRTHLLVLGILLVYVAATVTSVDKSLALWGHYERRLGLVTYVELAALYVGTIVFVRSSRDARILLGAATLGAFVVFVYAVVQRLGLDPVKWNDLGVERAFSTLGNPTVMGVYFACVGAAGCSASLLASDRRRPVVVVAALAGACGIAGVLLSGSRAALLGLALGVLIPVLLVAWRTAAARARWSLLIGGVVVVLSAVGFATIASGIGHRILAIAQGTDISAADRLVIYSTAMRIIADHPLLGVGPDNLAALYLAYRPAEALELAYGGFANQSSAHGWPWQYGINTGLVGVLAFVALVVTVGVRSMRQVLVVKDQPDAAALGALGGFVGAGLVSVNDIGTEWILWVSLGLIVASTTPRQVLSLRQVPSPRWALPIVGAVLVPVLFFMWRDVEAARALRASRDLSQLGRPAPSVREAVRATELDARWLIHWTNLTIRAHATGDTSVALRAAEQGVQTAPYESVSWVNLSSQQVQVAAQERGRPREAILKEAAARSIERARRVDPRNPTVHAAAARTYLLVGDFPASLRAAEVAVQLAPEVPEYRELAESARRRLSAPAEPD